MKVVQAWNVRCLHIQVCPAEDELKRLQKLIHEQQSYLILPLHQQCYLYKPDLCTRWLQTLVNLHNNWGMIHANLVNLPFSDYSLAILVWPSSTAVLQIPQYPPRHTSCPPSFCRRLHWWIADMKFSVVSSHLLCRYGRAVGGIRGNLSDGCMVAKTHLSREWPCWVAWSRRAAQTCRIGRCPHAGGSAYWWGSQVQKWAWVDSCFSSGSSMEVGGVWFEASSMFLRVLRLYWLDASWVMCMLKCSTRSSRCFLRFDFGMFCHAIR